MGTQIYSRLLQVWLPDAWVTCVSVSKGFSISQLIHSSVSSDNRLTGFLMCVFLPLLGSRTVEGFSLLYSFKSKDMFVSHIYHENVGVRHWYDKLFYILQN